MLKVICLSVLLLYVVCLSTIVDGKSTSRQDVSLLEKAQNNIRSLLSDNIGQEIIVEGEKYVLESLLGIVPPDVTAHKYPQYWEDHEFLHNAFLQLQFDVKKVKNVDKLSAAPTTETYYFSDKTFIAKGGFGKVYKATKYSSSGVKDTAKSYVVKQVATLEDAQKECAEYTRLPVSEFFVTCYGSALYKKKGYAVLDDAGKDLDKHVAAGHVHSADRKKIIKGVLGALKVLYDAGKAHKDVKPANICYKDGKVKLIDFGLLYSWRTKATLANYDKLEYYGRHATPFYRWPALADKLKYKSTDAGNKQAYVDRVKPLLYLVDVGGVFVTHLKLITRYDWNDVDTDCFSYYSKQHALVTKKGTFWVRYHVQDKEKAVLKALKAMDKTIDQLLAMPWFA